MTEQQIEQSLVEKLRDLKYTIRPDIRDRAALEQNFRNHFEALNRVKLTDGEYLVYLLLSEAFLEYAVKHSDRSKIPKVNRDTLLAYTVPIPPPAEQQRITSCLTVLDARITAQAAKIEALTQHKRGLMQQLFLAPEEADGVSSGGAVTT